MLPHPSTAPTASSSAHDILQLSPFTLLPRATTGRPALRRLALAGLAQIVDHCLQHVACAARAIGLRFGRGPLRPRIHIGFQEIEGTVQSLYAMKERIELEPRNELVGLEPLQAPLDAAGGIVGRFEPDIPFRIWHRYLSIVEVALFWTSAS